MTVNYADTVRTVDYSNAVELELAASPGLLAPMAMQGNHAGNKKVEVTNRFSQLQGYEIDDRNSKTAHVDPDVVRRWLAKPKRYTVPVIIDPDDQASTQVGLKSPLAMGISESIKRYWDDKFLLGFYGPALTGEEGTISTPFASANVIPADYGQTAATYVGFTYAKLQRLLLLMRRAFAIRNPGFKVNIAMTAFEIRDLFDTATYINRDFRKPDLAPLENGEPVDWMGVHWVPMEFDNAGAYPLTAAAGVGYAVNALGHRRLPCWLTDGMHLGTWLKFDGRDDIRPDLHHSEQIAGYSSVAATRLHENKCFIIESASA